MTRLMCSKHRDEVESVKSELFKAGIRCEVRSNPVAAALRVSRFELWVENESDHFKASKVYARMQGRSRGGDGEAGTEDAEPYIDIDELPPQSDRPAGSARAAQRPEQKGEPGGELEEASLMLEKEIEELLDRESELSDACASLRSKVEELTQSLSDAQAAAEKQATDFAGVKTSLEQQLAERTHSEEQLKEEVRELQARIKSGEHALSEKQRKLDATLLQLQTQQTAVVELRKELVAREQEFEEARRIAAKARAELEVEQNTRHVAEEKAMQAATAAKELEERVAEHKHVEQDMRAYLASVNALRKKLAAKKPASRVVTS